MATDSKAASKLYSFATRNLQTVCAARGLVDATKVVPTFVTCIHYFFG